MNRVVSCSELAVLRLQKARTRILLDQPFFSAILLRRALTESDRYPTLAVDVEGNIYYNPRFVARLTTDETVFALCHEILHVVGRHACRRGQRERQRWIYAADAWINDTLRHAGIGSPVDGTVHLPGSRFCTVDAIYASLPERPGGSSQRDGTAQGRTEGDAQNDCWDNGFGDDLVDGEQRDDGGRRDIEASVKMLVGYAAQEARSRGRMPLALERIVDDVLPTQLPWQALLERFMARCARDELAWRRPNRRFIARGIYLPTVSAETRIGTVVIGIDTSGSIDDSTLSVFVNEVNDIVEACHPERVAMIYCDTRIQRVDHYAPEDFPLQARPQGGGGTDLREIFDYVEREGLAPDCLLLFTDCRTPWPEQASWPTVVCSTTGLKAPTHLADTIHFPEDAQSP